MPHTPGPWSVQFRRYDKFIFINEASACVDCDDVTEEEAEERMANAKLMAAAPDFLAALQELIAAEDGPPDQIRDAFENARRVIKANS